MHTKTIAELSKALANKTISSEELTTLCLKRITDFNPELNCIITVTEEQALLEAKAADLLIHKKQVGALTGIPFVHKDIFCTQNIKTTCGSKMLDNFIPPYDAEIVQKLKKAGAILAGKSNMDEFAMGSSNETSYYGPVKNPWDLSKVPGGSSGGSAAAVAARLVPAATGSDTGGSIRQPAALCGITGLKPTYGAVSRFGMIAFASSLDQAGPMAATAEDCAILLEAMAGFDAKDSTSINRPATAYTQTLTQSLKGVRLGLVKEFFSPDLNPQVMSCLQEALKTLKSLGASIQEISLPNAHLGISAYYIIAPAECSSNLSRFDGVRFGYRCKDPKDLEDLYERTRKEGFGAEVKRRILLGTYVLSAGYYNAYYRQAQQVRRLIRNDFAEAFTQVDAIISPTAPTPAFGLGEKISDPVSMYLSDAYTIGVNLAGLPALSMPGGFIEHLPVGIQLIGNYFEEAKILNIAHQFQTVTNWHTNIPSAFLGENK